MRVWVNGRGAHPPLRSTTLHQWCLDETSSGADAADLMGSTTITQHNTPTVLTPADAAPGGPSIGMACRRFNGTNTYFQGGAGTAGADAASLTGAGWTAVVSVRLSSSWSARGDIVCYGAAGEEPGTPGSNNLLHLWVDANRNVNVFWEYGSGTNALATFTQCTLKTSRWYRIAAVRSGATVSLYVDGTLVGSVTQASAPNTSSAAQRWTIGCSETAGTQVFNGDIDSVTIHTEALADSDVEDAFRTMALLTFETTVRARAFIKDSGGTFQDLTGLVGMDWLKSWSISGDVDSPGESLSLELWKTQGEYVLSPLNNNPLNRSPLPSSTAIGVDAQTYVQIGSGTPTEILTPRREVRFDVARLPLGIAATSTDWQERFRGYLDKPDWGGDSDSLKLTVRDISGKLSDAWIFDYAKKYGTDGGRLVQDVLQDMLDDAYAKTVGSQRMLDTAYTLLVEDPPTWLVKTYTQERVPLIQAMQNLAEMTGWAIRTRWDYAAMAYKIAIYEPERRRTWGCITLTEDDFETLPGVAFDMASVRTAVRLVYFPATTGADAETATTPLPSIPTGNTTKVVGTRTFDDGAAAPAGGDSSTPPPQAMATITVTTEDLDSSEVGYSSLATFGVLMCEVTEAGTGPIRTVAPGQAMAVGILRDLCLPKAEVSGASRCLPELEVGDPIRLRAPSYSTSNLDIGLTRVGSGPDAGTFDGRGLPAGAITRHLEKEGRPGTSYAPALNRSDVAAGASERQRLRILDAVVNRSGLIQQARNALLRNPRFLSRNFGGLRPPDGWVMSSVSTGVWGTDVLMDATTVRSGPLSMRFLGNGVDTLVVSDFAPVGAGQVLGVECTARSASGTPTVYCDVEFFDSSFASLGGPSGGISTATSTTWQTFRMQQTAPANARWFRVQLSRALAAVTDIYVDSIDAVVLQPSARAFMTSSIGSPALKSWTDVVFDDDSTSPGGWDYGGAYNAATGAYTCAEDGLRAITARVKADFNRTTPSISTTTAVVSGTTVVTSVTLTPPDFLYLRLLKNGAEVMKTHKTSAIQVAWAELNVGDLYLAAGDVLKVQYWMETTPAGCSIVGGSDTTFFSVRKVSPE